MLNHLPGKQVLRHMPVKHVPVRHVFGLKHVPRHVLKDVPDRHVPQNRQPEP